MRRAKGGETSEHPLGGKELRAHGRLQRETPEGARMVYVFVSERMAPLSVAGYQRMVARVGELDGRRAGIFARPGLGATNAAPHLPRPLSEEYNSTGPTNKCRHQLAWGVIVDAKMMEQLPVGYKALHEQTHEK